MRALRTYVLLLLLVFSIPFGLAMGLFADGCATRPRRGCPQGSSWAASAALLTLVLAVVDRLGDREVRPGEPHGPRQETQVPIRGGADLPDRICRALLALPGELRDVDVAAGRYIARTRWTWRSFGEDVTVQLTGDPGSPVAHVSGRPVVRTTLIDYGQGRRNVHQLLEALRQ